MDGNPGDLIRSVHAAARDGKCITLCALLLDKSPSEVKQALNSITEEDGQVTTPLLIAARNGHEGVVKVLLTQFHVDIEQSGMVKFDGYTSEGACALWCAASGGHARVVQMLVEHGADVNHPTASNSTPLRVACFEGRLDLVHYLVSEGADVHISNKFRNSCLMIAAYKGHQAVVHYLLEKGARPNDRAVCGASALHFAAERGHLHIAELLVNYGAELFPNGQGVDPLLLAAESGHANIVEFFISLPQVSKSQYVAALELLGASYANDKDNYNLSKCYHYLWLAMQERYKDPDDVLVKKVLPAIAAYGNHVECQNIAELEAIKHNHNALHMEALIVRERILGEDNPVVPHPIVYRGAVFADSGRFDRCTILWLRALFLRFNNNRSISKDLLRFAQVFSQMVHVGATVDFKLVEHVLEHCLAEFARDKVRIAQAESDINERCTAVNIWNTNVRTALYLLVILLKIKKTEEDKERLCQLTYELNTLQLRAYPMDKEYTPLHMACDENTLVDDFHVDEVVHFPNDSLVHLLLQCGADVHAVDAHGNTALHVIVQYNRPLSDFLTLHSIILHLIEAGTHMDRTNYDGKTALDLVTTGVAEIILRTERKIELKCLAASAVRRHKLDYKGNVPVMLEEFIEMH